MTEVNNLFQKLCSTYDCVLLGEDHLFSLAISLLIANKSFLQPLSLQKKINIIFEDLPRKNTPYTEDEAFDVLAYNNHLSPKERKIINFIKSTQHFVSIHGAETSETNPLLCNSKEELLNFCSNNQLTIDLIPANLEDHKNLVALLYSSTDARITVFNKNIEELILSLKHEQPNNMTIFIGGALHMVALRNSKQGNHEVDQGLKLRLLNSDINAVSMYLNLNNNHVSIIKDGTFTSVENTELSGKFDYICNISDAELAITQRTSRGCIIL